MSEKNEQKQTTMQEQRLLTIGDLVEQPGFLSVLRLLPKFNLNLIPDDFPYKDGLCLKEKVLKDEDGVAHRTEYIRVPKRGVTKLSGGRVAIDPSLSKRFDDLLVYLNNDGEIRKFVFGNANIKKYLTLDGTEIYTYNGIEILEVRGDVCKECKTCNELRPELSVTNNKDRLPSYIEYTSRQWFVRDIREYRINPPFLGLLYGTGVQIAEITHPCQYITLEEILSQPMYKTADPPTIKIVFPKQEN